ncbi:unnamed protein product [Brassica rapa subsp. trilocularis]
MDALLFGFVKNPHFTLSSDSKCNKKNFQGSCSPANSNHHVANNRLVSYCSKLYMLCLFV